MTDDIRERMISKGIKIIEGTTIEASGHEFINEKRERLRDEFAASALSPYMTWSLNQPPNDECHDSKSAAAKYASVAYQIADAMLKEREK